MLLDCLGGPTGATGTVVSRGERVCNDTVTDVGTDPPAFEVPDPVIPDVPGIDVVPPDLPAIEEPDSPPPTALFIGCDAHDVFGPEDTVPADEAPSPFRFGSDGWAMEQDDDGNLTGLLTVGASDFLFYNTTAAPTLKTIDNDYQFGPNEPVRVLFTATMYHEAASQLAVSLFGPALFGGMSVQFVTAPGIETPSLDFPNGIYGITAYTENQAPGWEAMDCDPFCPAYQGNGGFAGTPIVPGVPFTVSIFFDPARLAQRIEILSDVGETLRVDNEIHPGLGTPLTYADCPTRTIPSRSR